MKEGKYAQAPWDNVPIRASDERCPCGIGLFERITRCNESTDYLNLHFDICPDCGFETYAQNEMSEKVVRYHKWRRTGVIE